MRNTTALALCLIAGPSLGLAQDLSGDITIWSWNIAASSLESVAKDFTAANPGVKVTVEDLGNQQVFDRMLAACAAGGTDLPDIVTVENHESEIFWSQFPSCFVDLKTLGYDDVMAAQFPAFKRTEVEPGGVAYAMPWDSGPVAMFYRRDFYEKAGVDPAAIKTWADFIAAGEKIRAVSPDVVMAMADLNGDTEWFRMMANEQGCGYFSDDAQSITVNKPGCVAALETLKGMKDAGVLAAGNWDEKIQSNNAGTVATQMYGGWYEGTVRSTAPEDQAGKWGVYAMPSMSAEGNHAANLGGSSLAIASTSDSPEAAFAFLKHALTTNEGQVKMLKEYGLVPSLLTAVDDPYVAETQAFWGDQAVWQTILETLPRVAPSRGTAFFGDADGIMRTVQTGYLNGSYESAQAALDDAAHQIELVTGLQIAQ